MCFKLLGDTVNRPSQLKYNLILSGSKSVWALFVMRKILQFVNPDPGLK